MASRLQWPKRRTFLASHDRVVGRQRSDDISVGRGGTAGNPDPTGGGSIVWTPLDPATNYVVGVTPVLAAGAEPAFGVDGDFLYLRGVIHAGTKTGPSVYSLTDIPIPRPFGDVARAAPIYCQNIGSTDPNVPTDSIGFASISDYVVGGQLYCDVYINRAPMYLGGSSWTTASANFFLSPAAFAWSP